MTDSGEHQKVMKLIEGIKIAMLATRGPDGRLRSRPMAISDTADEGVLYFLTGSDSGKVHDVEGDPETVITFAEPRRNVYVALRGEATIVTDRERIKPHWTEVARAWFPKGVDDPNLALLRVQLDEAQYWDEPNGKMVVAFGYIKAMLTGERPQLGEHGSIKM